MGSPQIRSSRTNNALWLCVVLGLLTAPPAWAETQAERGEYLATIMDCHGCHTDGALAGKPDPALHLAGSSIGFEIPGLGIFYPPNLTPDPETGLGAWKDADIATALRTGVRPDGRELAPMMPWRTYAALKGDDMRALVAYLKGLKPVRNPVSPPVGPNEKAPGPYLTVVVPQ